MINKSNSPEKKIFYDVESNKTPIKKELGSPKIKGKKQEIHTNVNKKISTISNLTTTNNGSKVRRDHNDDHNDDGDDRPGQERAPDLFGRHVNYLGIVRLFMLSLKQWGPFPTVC